MSGLDDVIPIGVTIGVDDCVQDMWMGRRICDVYGYGENGWTDSMILDYLCSLVDFHDKFVESQAPWVLPAFGDLVLPDGAHLGRFVTKCYEHYGDKKVSEILIKLGVSVADWWDSLCPVPIGHENHNYVITAETLDVCEEFFTAISYPYEVNQLMKNTGFPKAVIDDFRKMFAHRRVMIHGENALKVDRAPNMLKHLVLNTDYTTPEILGMVYRSTGVRFSRSYASKIRVRARNNIDGVD